MRDLSRCAAICSAFRGPEWTTLEQLRPRHRNAWQIRIGTTRNRDARVCDRPARAPLAHGGGQLSLGLRRLIDNATIELDSSLGGLSGIAISHPHYYTTMVEWSRAFHDVPIHLHASDREWVMRPDHAIQFWESDRKKLAPESPFLAAAAQFPAAPSCTGATARTAAAPYSQATSSQSRPTAWSASCSATQT